MRTSQGMSKTPNVSPTIPPLVLSSFPLSRGTFVEPVTRTCVNGNSGMAADDRRDDDNRHIARANILCRGAFLVLAREPITTGPGPAPTDRDPEIDTAARRRRCGS